MATTIPNEVRDPPLRLPAEQKKAFLGKKAV
jgi:hypothetical protein